MKHLIDQSAQNAIAKHIDQAVAKVLGRFTSHGNEEALTSVLGHELQDRSFREGGLQVDFRYRQLNKITEEPNAGADGGFLVRVQTPDQTVVKAALFQAKILGGVGDVRSMRMSRTSASDFQGQVTDMLKQTSDSVAVFYTWKNIYVVDASDYTADTVAGPQRPLAQSHRLITLGTYLGKWMPRCTKGDQDQDFITRVKHWDGFKILELDVVSQQPAVSWEPDRSEQAWKRRGAGRKQ